MLTVILSLFLNSVWTIFFCVLVNALSGVYVCYKYTATHPKNGVIILDANQLRFEGDSLKVQGKVGRKSRLLNSSLWLYIEGFSKNYWLIISANSIDTQNYTRLKRIIVSTKNTTKELK